MTKQAQRTKPLDGVNVVDLSALGPGPFFTQCLVDMGAEVTKIERPPIGDAGRVLSPGGHRVLNIGKTSLWVDLKDPAALAEVRALMANADIVVEGFRPGAAARLGLGYADIAPANRRVVYVSISGYGQSGPYRLLPGHDLNYLAASGFLGLTQGPGGGPDDVTGVPVGDFFSSLYALSATLAALLQARQSGEGQWLDVSMTDCLTHVVNSTFADLQQRGITEPEDQRRSVFTRPGYGVFRTRDGFELSIGALEDNFWRGLVQGLDLDLGDVPHESYAERVAAGERINAIIAAAVATFDLDDAIMRLARLDVPVMPVVALKSLPTTALSQARGLFAEIDALSYARFPVSMAGGVGRHPPDDQ